MPDSGSPLRRWLRAGLPLLLVVVLGVVVALVVRGTRGSDTGADGDLTVVPGSAPSTATTSPPTETATEPVTEPVTDPATSTPYAVVAGRALTLKPAIAAAKAALPSAIDFRISTFNALGNSHTAADGDRPSWASGVTRMGWAWQLLGGADIDVIGFQEFQTVQVDAFRSLTGGSYEVYPGTAQGWQNAENSLAWRSSTWQAVETHTVGIPYFGGHIRRMPYVLLRHVGTGQEVWFVNVHNPADKFGAAGRWRAEATARERALVDQLGAGGIPVLLTGDMNDRETAFCSLTQGTSLHAADGGTTSGGCIPPAQPAVDWIFGTGPVQFTSYTRVQTGLIRQTTDHPFVWAEVHIEPTG